MFHRFFFLFFNSEFSQSVYNTLRVEQFRRSDFEPGHWIALEKEKTKEGLIVRAFVFVVTTDLLITFLSTCSPKQTRGRVASSKSINLFCFFSFSESRTTALKSNPPKLGTMSLSFNYSGNTFSIVHG